jgi:hypothetical protein
MPLESRRSYVSSRLPYFVLDGLRVEATCFAGFSDQDRAGVEGRQLGPPPVRAAAHACALHAEPGIRLFSLQQGPGRRRAATIPAEDIAVPDIESLAATIMTFDLIVTIETMVAHLAGALGTPVLTTLHADCDWRWPKTARRSI